MPPAHIAFWPALLSAAIVFGLAGAAAAGTAESMASPKCLKAEINPVTGHVLCIDPLGAPVEAPPPVAKPRCQPEDARGQWSWGPACEPEIGGS
ncbi:MAG: hypothetical protein AB7V40_12190 [Methyloceanibacter sp.]